MKTTLTVVVQMVKHIDSEVHDQHRRSISIWNGTGLGARGEATSGAQREHIHPVKGQGKTFASISCSQRALTP